MMRLLFFVSLLLVAVACADTVAVAATEEDDTNPIVYVNSLPFDNCADLENRLVFDSSSDSLCIAGTALCFDNVEELENAITLLSEPNEEEEAAAEGKEPVCVFTFGEEEGDEYNHDYDEEGDYDDDEEYNDDDEEEYDDDELDEDVIIAPRRRRPRPIVVVPRPRPRPIVVVPPRRRGLSLNPEDEEYADDEEYDNNELEENVIIAPRPRPRPRPVVVVPPRPRPRVVRRTLLSLNPEDEEEDDNADSRPRYLHRCHDDPPRNYYNDEEDNDNDDDVLEEAVSSYSRYRAPYHHRPWRPRPRTSPNYNVEYIYEDAEAPRNENIWEDAEERPTNHCYGRYCRRESPSSRYCYGRRNCR